MSMKNKINTLLAMAGGLGAKTLTNFQDDTGQISEPKERIRIMQPDHLVQVYKEYWLIQEKKSTLSANKRKRVLALFVRYFGNPPKHLQLWEYAMYHSWNPELNLAFNQKNPDALAQLESLIDTIEKDLGLEDMDRKEAELKIRECETSLRRKLELGTFPKIEGAWH